MRLKSAISSYFLYPGNNLNASPNQMRRPPNQPLAKKLAKRFKGKTAKDYFRFMTVPEVSPTNNGTEQQVRHTVINRRITQITRGQAGIRWCEPIWTTIATCKKQEQDVFDSIHESIIAHWSKQNIRS